MWLCLCGARRTLILALLGGPSLYLADAPFCSFSTSAHPQVAERTISDDLEYLIEKAVNPASADYAVITGVEVHNWAAHLEEGGEPSMEFIAPTKAYVVVNGVKTHLDLAMVPVSGHWGQRTGFAQQPALPCHVLSYGPADATTYLPGHEQYTCMDWIHIST